MTICRSIARCWLQQGAVEHRTRHGTLQQSRAASDTGLSR